MAHYDCSNCGEDMGIAFGYCMNCTPQEYFDAEKRLDNLNKEAKDEWKSRMKAAEEFFIENYKKEERDGLLADMERIKKENKF